MIAALTLAVAVLAQQETALRERIPEIFARSAAHYRALDAAAARLRTASGAPCVPHGFRRETRELDMRPVTWWTAGHFPGSLWYLYEATGDDFFRSRALDWTRLLAPNAKVTGNHDVGFIMYCSYGNARRLLKTDEFDALLTETAESLSKRFHPGLGLIRSWGAITNGQEFLVIPDNMMNLELLEWAARNAKDSPFARIAESHADVSMKNHFRPDGGAYHVLNYCPKDGRVQEIRRGQGASVATAWSRGQSWAIYGYTMMYRNTGYRRYLDFARKLADYAMDHPNMPADGIPYWDYGAPGEERDSSAGSVMASALLELSRYLDASGRARYRAFAVRQLLSLSSDDYFSSGDEIGHFLLKHGTGNKPGFIRDGSGGELDTPLDYGDYYFLEALLRFRAICDEEAALAPLAAKLPPKPSVPSGEAKLRMWKSDRRTPTLDEPIPAVTDEQYLEYWRSGDRKPYETPFYRRNLMLDFFTCEYERTGDARYARRLNELLASYCELRTWILPAHDHLSGGRGNFDGTVPTVALLSGDVAASLGFALLALGDRADPSVAARVRELAERRVFAPLRRELPYSATQGGDPSLCRNHLHFWLDGSNNWSAVCPDNVVAAACALLEDPLDRARFVAAAMKIARRYVEEGFPADGYCDEGVDYWNYGFGHHLMMGRLLRFLTDGKVDLFTLPKQRAIAAYGRGVSFDDGRAPFFADGGYADPVDPVLLGIVDEVWPDLPRTRARVTEFPDGQVWVFRDAEGLSVAFKGGSNGEHHNHNDVGSYCVFDRGTYVSGDPGVEEYTAKTFSAQRYDSKIIGSYGHPVPLVGGQPQVVGGKHRARVLSKAVSPERTTVVLELKDAYEVPALESLTRTFVCDRRTKAFTVRDRVRFSAPTAFEDPYNAYDAPLDVQVRVLAGGPAETVEERIPNPGYRSPRRIATRFTQPVVEAEVEFAFNTL